MISRNFTSYIPQWLLKIAIIFFILVVIFVGFYLIFENKFKDKIYPGIFISGYNMGGKTFDEAKQLINQQVDIINQRGITFYYKDDKAVISPVVASVESDLAYQIIDFGVERTINNALNLGRERKFSKYTNWLINLDDKINALIFKKRIILSVNINRREIEKILADKFLNYNQPAEDAKLLIKQPGNEVTIIEEKLGKVIDYEEAISELSKRLSFLDDSSIKLVTKSSYPQIYKNDCLNIENKVNNILNLAPIIVKYNKEEWRVEKEKLIELLGFKIREDLKEDKIIVGFDEEKTSKYFKEEIALKINKEPIDAKFEIRDGKVIGFQGSQDGRELDLELSIAKLDEETILQKKNSIELIVIIKKSNINTGDVNNLGIKEIIGVGNSNFIGSPANRRHNIKVGASTLNGQLIKPDQEFSLIKALGKIDGATGYLPELVIKENKTIPEFGGGLCQIGTTMFRAALASGLPITMRQNHSYRVSYYEPAGTDATIYDPWPDFRFINDTGSYILIQARIEGDNLYFDFWGTKDGRAVYQTKPTIYNIIKPGPTKIVETLDLKPGEKKCTEKPHNGADTYFDYKVTYQNGEVKEKRFSSHYVPWREVCLLGVEKLSAENNNGENQNATSSPSVINQ